MRGLVELVSKNFAAAEADFQRFYNLHLARELWGPNPMSARRLAALTASLPYEAALLETVGVSTPGWAAQEELLAAVVELTDQTNRLIYIANSKKGTTPPKPIKVPRPKRGEPEETKKRPATSEEIAAWFGAAGPGAIRYTGPKAKPLELAPGENPETPPPTS